jgi:hypothetical protein
MLVYALSLPGATCSGNGEKEAIKIIEGEEGQIVIVEMESWEETKYPLCGNCLRDDYIRAVEFSVILQLPRRLVHDESPHSRDTLTRHSGTPKLKQGKDMMI